MSETKTPPNLSPPDDERKINPTPEEPLTKEQIIGRIKRRYEDGVGAFEENRRMHSEDLNFVYNSESMGQWDPVVLEARRGKPCYTFNRVIGPVNIVVADMRQSKPAGKVRPTNEAANEATAEVLAGLMRSIEDESRADPIYKMQYKFAVAGGFGAWRLMPEWASEDSFDQVLRIKDIPNPQTVIWDPECSDACAGDAMWCIIGERVSREKYRVLFPGIEPSYESFHISRDSYGWFTDKEVRVVEYMERIPFEKVIALLDNGEVIDYTDQVEEYQGHLDKIGDKTSARIAKKRTVLKWRVMWCKADGSQVLEGPIYYDWRRIPVIRVPGRYINIEGRKKLQSLVRHAKDAQRSYNSRVSDMIERSALTPKAPYLVTETMVKGYEAEWNQANTASRPYLPYNVDKAAIDGGGMPQRTPPIDMPQAALALAQAAAQDIQATTGYFDPALGNAEDMNRVSGKALIQHTRRSDLGSFEFIDGFGDALQLTWEIGIDMIPTIYDTERVVRIVGNDEVEKMVQINGGDASAGDVIHDLQKGSYACKVTIGPSYQTARQEALASLIDAAEAMPILGQVAPDLFAKNMDIPDADELSRRLRIPLIHQGIIQPTEQEKAQLPPPPPPDPMQQAELQRMQALAQRDGASAQIQQAKAQDIPIERQKQIFETQGKQLSNMKTQQDLGGGDAQKAQVELQVKAATGAMDIKKKQEELKMKQMEFAMKMRQMAQEHQMTMTTQHQQHQLDMAHAKENQQVESSITSQTHQQTMAHGEETHKAKLKETKEIGAAKAKAAAKPKPKKPAS